MSIPTVGVQTTNDVSSYLLQVSRPLGLYPVAQLQVPIAPEQTALLVVQLPWVFPAATPVHAPPSLPGEGAGNVDNKTHQRQKTNKEYMVKFSGMMFTATL